MTTPPALRVLMTTTAVLCLLSACAGGGAEPASGDPTSAGPDRPAVPPSATAAARPSGTAAPEDLSVTPSGRITVLTGTVELGVEPGCLLLQASGVLHLLVGAVEGLQQGQRVTVQGRPDPTLMSTCQQGTPFVVVSTASA